MKNKYDLIYVPAETYMLSLAEDKTIRSFTKLKKPVKVLFLGERENKFRVLHENKEWLIEKTHLRGIYD